MIGVYDFCGHYEWTFEWLRREGGENLVHDYWEEAISHDSQLHARELIIPGGISGMKQYWGHTLDEEGARCTITQREDVFRVDMHVCPSKGFLLLNKLEQYHDYCDHCMGWIKPLMDDAGFHISHQHNHRGKCWWEIRAANEANVISPVGDVAGADDVRLDPTWQNEGHLDSFGCESSPAALAVIEVQTGESASAIQGDTVENSPSTVKPKFFTALVTPMHEDDGLHVESLALLIEQQVDAGVAGFLAGGTMGAMQLLPDTTYRDLMRETARLVNGRGELLAGAGDTSFARTRERIDFLNTLALDGVVVLTPYLIPFSQEELVEYFSALADFSRAPLFLYDLPALTRTKLALSTVEKLAQHPNIAGIKCSDEPGYARQVRDLVDDRFRVILAAPALIDVFLRDGYLEHLDGVYCLCPQLLKALDAASVAGDWKTVAEQQRGINRLLQLIRQDEVWRPATALLNELGIPGRFKPRPHRDLDEQAARTFLETEEVRAVLQFLRQS